MEQRHLRSLVDLECLAILGFGETPVSIASVGHLRSLKDLRLLHARTDNAQIAHLVALRNLEHLDLGQTRVTDAAIEYLKEMRSLRLLYIRRASITAQGWKELQAALPDCDIRLQINKGLTQ